MKAPHLKNIKVVPNQSRRTFTIRKYYSDGQIAKYRTNEMSQEEFDSESRNTNGDWEQFLKTDNYYKV